MSADEFDVIQSLFAPLAGDGARGFLDDVAVLDARGPLVVTSDAIVEGVHFLASDPIETVAMKALRVNISDLVGKGAKPVSALLTLVWPQTRDATDIGLFADGLRRDLKQFGMTLLGGDTTSTLGPLTISITAFGQPLGARTPARADAKVGDDVWLVGGEIGSAWLGLQLRTGALTLLDLKRGREQFVAEADEAALRYATPDYLTLPGEEFDAEAAWLMSAYLAPLIRPEVADIVARFAHASMDISDGLVGDAQKLAAASGVALKLDANTIPLSFAAQRWAFSGGDFRKLITGGDDYVVLFTAPVSACDDIARHDREGALRLTRIGRVEAGADVEVVDARGQIVPMEQASYAHRLGR